MAGQNEEDTRLKAARTSGPSDRHRLGVFWQGGSSSYDLPPSARLVVGRAEDCDVVIADDSVSRRHAAVQGGQTPWVEDLGSANGTWVGEARIEPGTRASLSPTTVIGVGDALLVVCPGNAADRPSMRSAVEPTAEPDGPMARVLELVDRVAVATIPVLLLGETGVGKGVIAEAIHKRSPRAAGPFVRINCAAIAETLLETELFGHERGAFTGAQQSRAGLLESASGGTVLLDEIGDMALSTQAKLLHALEHGEVLRVGAVRPRPIDVRIVAATNRELQALASDGRFRQDLYFRLAGVVIHVPPLRERPAEIASLARAFVREASEQLGRITPTITTETMKHLLAYAWPGNVRELRNAMVRATLLAQSSAIGVEQFVFDTVSPASSEGSAARGQLRAQVRGFEKQRIVEALERCGHNQVAAAKALGISRGTLRSRMKELGLLPR